MEYVIMLWALGWFVSAINPAEPVRTVILVLLAVLVLFALLGVTTGTIHSGTPLFQRHA